MITGDYNHGDGGIKICTVYTHVLGDIIFMHPCLHGHMVRKPLWAVCTRVNDGPNWFRNQTTSSGWFLNCPCKTGLIMYVGEIHHILYVPGV